MEQRIRLNVITNTGVDFIFSANPSWKIQKLAYIIEETYAEITGITRVVKKNSIKRRNFVVPFQEKIMMIFDDGDEVSCQMIEKEQSKKNIIERKAKEKPKNDQKEKPKKERPKQKNNIRDIQSQGQKNSVTQQKKGKMTDKILEIMKKMNKEGATHQDKKQNKIQQKKTQKIEHEPLLVIKQSDSD